MIAKFSGVLVFFVMLNLSPIVAQEISISHELNLRNYYAYDIIGDVDGRIIVYRDRGFVKEIDVFNQDMENTFSTELTFEKKRVDVLNVVGLDSVFQILYGFYDNDTLLIKQRIYDRRVILTDSLVLAKVPKRNIRKKFEHVISEDKNKILLYATNIEYGVSFLLYDSRLRQIIWEGHLEGDDFLSKNLNSIELSNTGDFVLSLNNKQWFSNKESLKMVYFSPRNNLQKSIFIPQNTFFKESLFVKHDNSNNTLIISGTYSEKQGQDIKGYFYTTQSFESIGEEQGLTFVPFKETFYKELLHGRKKKSRVLNDLVIQDIILRNDGGIIFISEIQREFSRRNPYNSYSRGAEEGFTRGGWVDYYNDDIVVTNFNPDGELEWNKVLYKKQFSQDDDGIFSSFFIMKTPSRLRFIYNDEIKKNSTVSEYLIGPTGKMARNSLLSTEYQNMKLRFKDAVQISSSAIVVPSERNYDLNLVKITY